MKIAVIFPNPSPFPGPQIPSTEPGLPTIPASPPVPGPVPDPLPGTVSDPDPAPPPTSREPLPRPANSQYRARAADYTRIATSAGPRTRTDSRDSTRTGTCANSAANSRTGAGNGSLSDSSNSAGTYSSDNPRSGVNYVGLTHTFPVFAKNMGFG